MHFKGVICHFSDINFPRTGVVETVVCGLRVMAIPFTGSRRS